MFGRADATTGSALARRIRRLSALERSEEARAFLDAYHDAAGHGRALRQRRWAEVRRDLHKRGHYDHNPDELAFGARLAWRNTGRCIGRLPWESLEVADCREITDPHAIAARMSDHLQEADSGGGIRSLISVFAPVKGTDLPAWIESSQIVRYACHHLADGTVMGDRQNAEATRLARSMGWHPNAEPVPFDLLPYFVRDANYPKCLSVASSGISHPSSKRTVFRQNHARAASGTKDGNRTFVALSTNVGSEPSAHS